MTDLPLISVVVPVYRLEKYLDHCIQSIAAQTYPNLEILLVDDGSPDGSGAICDRWAEKDSRIRVFHKQNAGAGAARNTALDAAAGELIAFVAFSDSLTSTTYTCTWSPSLTFSVPTCSPFGKMASALPIFRDSAPVFGSTRSTRALTSS